MISFIFPVLLTVGMTGCAAQMAPENAREEEEPYRTEWSGRTAWEDIAAVAQGAAETAASSEHAAALAVTDHRVNNAVVKEYTDREAFLYEYGFDSQEPFYEYYAEDGALQLELYYDRYSGVGCGLRYYPGEELEAEGFLFNGSNNYRYYTDFMKGSGIEADRYSVISFEGSDGRDEAEDYEESAIYGEDGRLLHYTSQGRIPYLTEKEEMQKILEIEWSYREDGTLQERNYWHNSMVFGTWYSSRQSYYDEQERLVHEHCYVTHGSVDFYYIYAKESEVPAGCLILDHNTGLLCAELLEYHGAGEKMSGAEEEMNGTGGKMYYGRIGPMLAGETENQYAAAVIELAEEEGKDYKGHITHTYAADYDGDGAEEAFVILGREIKDEYEHDIAGWCFFVNSDLEVSLCIDRASAFGVSQQFICQDGITYLLICYSIGIPWQAELYTVRDHVPVEVSGTYANKYIDRQGQVIQIEDAYDGECWWVNQGAEEGKEEWEPLWLGHTWKPYTFILDHGELKEVPAREVTREKVEQIAPLPADFDEIAQNSIKQYILRDNGELNINMAVESDYVDEGETSVYFSYITYRLNGDGQWEYVEEQGGYYMIQFSDWSRWDYIEKLYQKYGWYRK